MLSMEVPSTPVLHIVRSFSYGAGEPCPRNNDVSAAGPQSSHEVWITSGALRFFLVNATPYQ
ncbi:hypothetical protein GCM10022202_28720 [Microbacterium marinilacus]|uniref:Uncharacterized protein n=1 Tax=Microbacterium marinilacus TaxID=415209 RepID=A0ABP7BQ20_9MICO